MSKYYKCKDVIRKRAEDLADTSYWEWGNPKNVDEWIEVAEMEFKKLPTIDIVTCKECKYWRTDEKVRCRLLPYADANDYCSYGERTEE